jgi:hypothetical protein
MNVKRVQRIPDLVRHAAASSVSAFKRSDSIVFSVERRLSVMSRRIMA